MALNDILEKIKKETQDKINQIQEEVKTKIKELEIEYEKRITFEKEKILDQAQKKAVKKTKQAV